MSIDSQIRTLAKSNYWQQIFQSSKECNGIQLFQNSSNFSGLQCSFLNWLRTYDLLYTELANKNWQILDIDVIKDDDRTSAFLYWRRLEIEKENREYKKEERKSKIKKGSRPFNLYKGPRK